MTNFCTDFITEIKVYAICGSKSTHMTFQQIDPKKELTLSKGKNTLFHRAFVNPLQEIGARFY